LQSFASYARACFGIMKLTGFYMAERFGKQREAARARCPRSEGRGLYAAKPRLCRVSSASLSVIILLVTHMNAAASADLDKLVADLQGLHLNNPAPAFLFTLVDKTQILHSSAHGVVDRASGRPANAASRFRIGSVTKTFTALALLLAEHEGLLSLDTPFRDIAGPGLIDNPWHDDVPIRISHLLEHSAGLSDLSSAEMAHSDPTPLRLTDAVNSFKHNRRVHWRPGEHYSYSNAGSGLAAYALEQAAATSYEEFVTTRLFAPLGMRSASLVLDQATARNLATGYDSDGTTPIPYWHMLMRPFGAINVSANDLAGVLMLLLNDGRVDDRQLVPASAIRRMERAETTLAARHGLEFGYGPGLYSWYSGGRRFYGHGGDGDGYLAHIGYNRESGLAYAIVINCFCHPSLAEFRQRIESFIVAQLPPASLPPDSLTPPELASTGRYRPATFRFGNAPAADAVGLQLKARDGALELQYGQRPPQRLLAVRPGLWRFADEAEATVAVVKNARGDWVFQGLRESFIRVDD
jgi:CubicO group peptidase (beta-lactamase class C family)